MRYAPLIFVILTVFGIMLRLLLTVRKQVQTAVPFDTDQPEVENQISTAELPKHLNTFFGGRYRLSDSETGTSFVESLFQVLVEGGELLLFEEEPKPAKDHQADGFHAYSSQDATYRLPLADAQVYRVPGEGGRIYIEFADGHRLHLVAPGQPVPGADFEQVVEQFDAACI